MASSTLHIFLLPLITPGHLLPMVDMAKLLAQRGVKASLVTTPGNAARIYDSLERGNGAGDGVQVLQVEFPSSVAGMPDGSDTFGALRTPYVTEAFFGALNALQRPFEQLVKEHAPDCLISDAFFPWTVDVAAKFEIPRIVFQGSGGFPLSVFGALMHASPHRDVSDDAEVFVLPGIPDRIEMTRAQLPEFILSTPDFLKDMGASQFKSYGLVLNTFQELEPGYCTGFGGLKTWLVGPVDLCNADAAAKAVRGEKAGDNIQRCLSWLDAQAPASVLYLCFGSLCRFTRPQLHEMALGLEAAGHPFLWVLRDVDDDTGGDVLPEGFEERTSGRGLLLRGWAPQLLILGHPAVGGFVTHCGWNSILEAVTAGLPMVAWPLFADQFVNEKLVVQVLRVGVAVGAVTCSTNEEERVLVRREKVERAVKQVMGNGEEGEAMRRRAKELSAMAKKAVELGGSSHSSLGDLIQDLVSLKKP